MCIWIPICRSESKNFRLKHENKMKHLFWVSSLLPKRHLLGFQKVIYFLKNLNYPPRLKFLYKFIHLPNSDCKSAHVPDWLQNTYWSIIRNCLIILWWQFLTLKCLNKMFNKRLFIKEPIFWSLLQREAWLRKCK